MTEILTFAGDHWFLAWMAIWGGSWIGMAIINGTVKLITELLVAAIKCLPIIFRGWPPEHIDDY